MPYFRKLPSGRWQATVRDRSGKKHTKTDPLLKVVKAWAAEAEAKIAHGTWRDPRAARTPVSEWAEKWRAARVVEDETRRHNNGTLNNHILPQWGKWQLGHINALDVQAWVRRMQKDGVGPHAIQKAYHLFLTMMRDAHRAGVLPEKPDWDVKLPATPTKLPAWFTRAQVDRIRAELDNSWYGDKATPLEPSRRGHSVMVELMVTSGLRWGEAAAAVGAVDDVTGIGNPVDWLRGRIQVIGALGQRGAWKPHPKTSKSRREVPVERHVLDEMAPLLSGRDRTDFVFVSRWRGRPLIASNWREVWYQAIDKANERIAAENKRLPEGQRTAPIPRLDPHDTRHTCASWMVQGGVPLYKVQELLGHESAATTQRYAHLAPDRHDDIEQVWKRMRESQTSRRVDGSAG